MDKLKMHSDNAIDQNIDRIAQLFPNCITEIKTSAGDIERAVDFDKLKSELSCHIAEGNTQRYQFTWPDKLEASRLANTPTTACLRPCRDESVDFDHTQNLYIEGDNLEVLKVLRHTYSGKVKMIYIDPPYNTGNDFVYEDDFASDQEEFLVRSGQKDESGNRLVANKDSNGRFHTDWLNMIYPRLKIARELLSDDGVIFISIDDCEVHNLRQICNELFGTDNFISQFVWQRAFSPKNDAEFVSASHEYVLMYVKNLSEFTIGRIPRTIENNKRFKNPDNDPRGLWASSDLSVKTYTKSCDYVIQTPSGRKVSPPSGRCWGVSESRLKELINDNRIWFGINGNNVPTKKTFLDELKHDGLVPQSLLLHSDVGHSRQGRAELKEILKEGVFDGPKPTTLIQRLMTIANLKPDSIVMDFFSGSATTAHALLKTNADSNKHCKFVMVQIPEDIDEASPAGQAGYKNICEVGKERIRRAGAAIKEEFGEKAADLDIGFRVLKLDSSNMKDTYYVPAKLTMASLIDDNVKADRTSEDLLFQAMLETDVLLSEKIERLNIGGKEVFSVSDGFVMACFDNELDMETVKEIASKQPSYFITHYESFNGDALIDNLDQLFAAYSSHTIIKII